MLKLSIIVPVYNVENYITECLECLVTQVTNECEVLLINDGSTDNSVEICRVYSENCKYIRLINQDNKGLSGARNTGICQAKGRYILFLDSDDYLEKNAIEILLRQIDEVTGDENDFYFIKSKSFHDHEINCIENQVNYGHIKEKVPAKIFLQLDKINDFWFAAWLIVINTKFLKKNNLYFKEGIFHEDELWVPQVFASANKCKLINESLYCYRQSRAGSIINQQNIKKELDKTHIIDELIKYKTFVNFDGKKLLDERCAALEFGLIYKLNQYKNEKKYNKLYEQVNKHICCIKTKKYWLIFWLSKICGISICSKILNKMIEF